MNENIDLTKILKNCPKGKFDPNTLNPFDRVLTRHFEDERWDINFYSYKKPNWPWHYICLDGAV